MDLNTFIFLLGSPETWKIDPSRNSSFWACHSTQAPPESVGYQFQPVWECSRGLSRLFLISDLWIPYNSLVKRKVSRNKYIWTHQFTQKSKENMLGVSKNGSEHFHFFAWFSRDLKNRSKSKFILLSMPFYSGTSRECWISVSTCLGMFSWTYPF